ncbi:hypothetical protein MMAD_03790 [Mycolicibacterium madagascariense]|uniref:Uncharacterized protein n=1 Tax=Mycolicibacterium madagascariense TaxID=212765 RepID=A0A7I7X947_9MYCO|nr:hypothetical protein [Mycolicibacterium madagascariense]MCV7012838.1 hypothetical protein [Mycolicibacterium madagascariense]BBZ26084.1 hypothetical protein MMAD_03790 [Mycolicibacterium madagascariense]
MESTAPMGEVFGDIAASLGRGGWVVTLASLLAIVAAGAAAGTVRRLVRRSTPEMIVLLNRSAAFYGRWPGDRLSSAPPAEVAAEVARCRRLVALLEARTPAGGDGAASGAMDGLRAWIALLSKRIDDGARMPSGPAYA